MCGLEFRRLDMFRLVPVWYFTEDLHQNPEKVGYDRGRGLHCAHWGQYLPALIWGSTDTPPASPKESVEVPSLEASSQSAATSPRFISPEFLAAALSAFSKRTRSYFTPSMTPEFSMQWLFKSGISHDIITTSGRALGLFWGTPYVELRYKDSSPVLARLAGLGSAMTAIVRSFRGSGHSLPSELVWLSI